MNELEHEFRNRRLESAQLLIDMGQAQKAAEELRAELAENPNSAEAEALLALALVMQKNFRAAEFHVRRALTHEPSDALSHYIYSLILQDTHRDAEAEREIMEAIRILPFCAPFHSAYAFLLYRHGQIEKAEAVARNALALDPEDTQALCLLGQSQMDEQQLQVAQDTFRRALAINPESPESHLGMGLTHLQRNETDSAYRNLRQAVLLDPTNESIRRNYLLTIQARHPLYSLFWRWSLLMHRMGTVNAILLISVLWVLYTATARWQQSEPDFLLQHPFLNFGLSALLYGYTLFVLYTWIAYPLFTFLARRGWIK